MGIRKQSPTEPSLLGRLPCDLGAVEFVYWHTLRKRPTKPDFMFDSLLFLHISVVFSHGCLFCAVLCCGCNHVPIVLSISALLAKWIDWEGCVFCTSQQIDRSLALPRSILMTESRRSLTRTPRLSTRFCPLRAEHTLRRIFQSIAWCRQSSVSVVFLGVFFRQICGPLAQILAISCFLCDMFVDIDVNTIRYDRRV